ncbi:MAG: class I SAM-dependent methyltransferase [Chloroflexi bacterium]|nr:class I SAM-dependent methyltransferase [Chloroflexota bacterium]
MDASEYDNIAQLEDAHWWYRGMAAISLDLIRSQLRAPIRFLDAGCGTGGMLRRLSPFGVGFGIDFSPLALAHAHRKIPNDLCRASITQLPFTNDSFDLITSFDVLYHRAIADDQTALNEIARLLKPNGIALIRLPAFESLRGAHDQLVHTRQRYTANELRQKLNKAGFKIKRLTYANFFLFIPIYLTRTWQLSHSKKESSDVELPSSVINSILESLLTIESLLIRYVDLPFGVSLFALAMKE